LEHNLVDESVFSYIALEDASSLIIKDTNETFHYNELLIPYLLDKYDIKCLLDDRYVLVLYENKIYVYYEKSKIPTLNIFMLKMLVLHSLLNIKLESLNNKLESIDDRLIELESNFYKTCCFCNTPKKDVLTRLCMCTKNMIGWHCREKNMCCDICDKTYNVQRDAGHKQSYC